jgi:transposase InsO family protein
VKFGFINAEKAQYSVSLLCEVLEVSRSGFYKWCQKASRRVAADEQLAEVIQLEFDKSGQRYGSPRVFNELRLKGVRTSKKRVARLMRQAKLVARPERSHRPRTTLSSEEPAAENLLGRDFQASRPNEKWVADITYLRTTHGFLYLAAIMDLFSRRIIGWSLSHSLSMELTDRTLDMALMSRTLNGSLMHHSDRGIHYTAKAYGERLTAVGVTRSMSRKGNCWDNAPMESFNSTLKAELPAIAEGRLHPREVQSDVSHYISWYNTERRHSSLGYMRPVEYEEAARMGRAA